MIPKKDELSFNVQLKERTSQYKCHLEHKAKRLKMKLWHKSFFIYKCKKLT